jgi:signal peptidase I
MDKEIAMKQPVAEWVRTIAGAAFFTFVLKTVAFATYYIPSESLVPTLEVGDRLIATKFDYGFSRYSTPVVTLPHLPVADGRLLERLPHRGDIVLFTHPATGETLVKRLIGLPGDRIRVTGGVVYINGVAAPRRFVKTYAYRQFEGPPVEVSEYQETLPGGVTHPIIVQSDARPVENTREFEVPAGHMFVMGDNRDNSADSRFAELGYVPVENLIGRSRAILYSLHDCQPEDGLTCAPRRYLTELE